MTGIDLKTGRKQKGFTQRSLREVEGFTTLSFSFGEGFATGAGGTGAQSHDPVRVICCRTPGQSELGKRSTRGFKHCRCRPGVSRLSGICLPQKARRRNPAEVLLSALSAQRLDTRVIEGLPWLLLEYPDLDWKLLISAAKLRDLQNRLGLVTCVARMLAEKLGEFDKAELLRVQETLERSRLLLEDTLCNDSLTQAEDAG